MAFRKRSDYRHSQKLDAQFEKEAGFSQQRGFRQDNTGIRLRNRMRYGSLELAPDWKCRRGSVQPSCKRNNKREPLLLFSIVEAWQKQRSWKVRGKEGSRKWLAFSFSINSPAISGTSVLAKHMCDTCNCIFAKQLRHPFLVPPIVRYLRRSALRAFLYATL